MELGNFIFGNSRGEHHVDRGYQDTFVEEVLYALGFSGYGIPEDEELVAKNGFTRQENGVYTNGVFSIFSYWWGDCTCGAGEESTEEKEVPCTEFCNLMLPNFVHHPSEFVLQWYKYALRDSYSNKPLTEDLLRLFIKDANPVKKIELTPEQTAELERAIQEANKRADEWRKATKMTPELWDFRVTPQKFRNSK